MVDNLFWKIVWVVVYAITAYFTFTGNMMMGMYWMAAGMLGESIVSLVYHFVSHQSMQEQMKVSKQN
ncbi:MULTISPECIES: hypothetical protein [Lactobacillus]|uniref:Uncharacterized protein n=1 Tax=Lactobacillus xujianguonis TaxID=2495899 RepID=A0A437SW13_9LACO|nr:MULTISPECIES: hypothetical protein [Lactobacillus]RVU71116.1 hypothetical protein EJK17_03685 [Lactobacillus xujianguonis]RVU77464.1 hypothetical protein EJK20_01510 [Lactobacillus xujianguonis]